MPKPDILFIMCDQLRYDSIAALGNSIIRTPNIDRLAARGAVFTNAYSTCPVCVPARYTIMTGCEPYNTCCYANEEPKAVNGLPETMEERCGPYLPRTLNSAGYYTFGVGKFHIASDQNLGFDVKLPTEELWGSRENMSRYDAYGAYLHEKYPCFDYIEQLHGERTEMYYMPQTSPLPAELTVENFTAERVVELINAHTDKEKPYFGFVSFIGPHPPFAPPIPYNRMYNPDIMPNPVKGDIACDHMDEQITWMNHAIWADELNDFSARIARARYYGEITYIDACLGKILDAVEARGNSDNTLICFFTDHGDMIGDHHAWQKECYFEHSCHIPFFVSLPSRIEKNIKVSGIATLSDLFGIATSAAEITDAGLRDGVDIFGSIGTDRDARDYLFACHMRPGKQHYKMMVRHGNYKYIYMANGGREQLFNLDDDKNELENLAKKRPDLVKKYKSYAETYCNRKGLLDALAENGRLKAFEFSERKAIRIHQFEGVSDFIISGV